jgi:UDP-N-acetylmuramoyl-L-alanyl-D-glutamate--2,6-diaminopimelate ligase
MTSLPARQLLKRVKELKQSGMDILVLEVTSHALAQYRTLGIPIDIAVFTNLTQDHLDYHGSFAAYRTAKVKLFKAAARNKKGRQLGIVNTDDENARYFEAVVPNVLRYGLKGGKGIASPKRLKQTAQGSSFEAEIQGKKLHITCNIPGTFNVANTLAAANVGVAMGLEPEVIERGIAAVHEIQGRMSRVEAGQDFTVLVDFAHTPDALEKVLSAARDIAKGKVYVVFGATGDRDKTKRPIMGRIAAGLADTIFLTDDETYTEDPASIRVMVREGIEAVGGNYQEIADRKEAIRAALQTAKKGDVVVLAGIGHEDSRNMGGKLVPWDEVAIVKELLKKAK